MDACVGQQRSQLSSGSARCQLVHGRSIRRRSKYVYAAINSKYIVWSQVVGQGLGLKSEGVAVDAQGWPVRLAAAGVEVEQPKSQFTAGAGSTAPTLIVASPGLELSTGWSRVAIQAPFRTMLSRLVHLFRR